MSNRILRIDVDDHSLIPAEAELRVTVVPDYIDSGTEVRGRLMGPRCRFASTVEVAYHLRRLTEQATTNALQCRVIIPEANLWNPVSPHLYAGPIELWQDGVRCDVVQVRHGLRHVSLGPRGLRLNGLPLTLHGREVQSLTESEALALRQCGHNLLLAPVSEERLGVWDLADQLGFFVLGNVNQNSDFALTAELVRHASCLGWQMTGREMPAGLARAPLLGAVAGTAPPTAANFLAVPAGETPPEESELPVLLLGRRTQEGREGPPVVLGTVDQSV
jgi:hypothetical protein